MEGVTVISEELVRQANLRNVIGVISALIIFFIIIVAICRYLYNISEFDKKIQAFSVGFPIVVFFVFIFMGWEFYQQYNTTHYEYVITVDDEVKFNEFFDIYEIIAQDENFYQVKEVNPEH